MFLHQIRLPHIQQPDHTRWICFASGDPPRPTLHAVGYAAPWVRCSPSSAQHVLGTLPYILSEVRAFVNGGPVLRWRGPFFFLPTNPLHSGILSFLRRLSTVFVGRNRQLLPMLTPFVSNGDSMDMENHISGAARLLCKYDLTGLRLLQQIQTSKINDSIIPNLGKQVK